jgi:ABC-2 type transport system ATP-binding protein
LGLAEKRNAPFAKLSGGQKQRLFIALSLINNPEVVFFDELTTGLDPQARHLMWDLVRSVREQGKTVLLTTHFMEEAERLCDRVAVMNRGKIIALDTPRKLILGLQAKTRVIFEVEGQFDSSLLDEVAVRVEREGNRVVVYGEGDKCRRTVRGSGQAGRGPRPRGEFEGGIGDSQPARKAGRTARDEMGGAYRNAAGADSIVGTALKRAGRLSFS